MDALRSQMIAVAELMFPARVRAVRQHAGTEHAWDLIHDSVYCVSHDVLLLPAAEDTPPDEMGHAAAMSMPAALIGILPADVYVEVIRLA